MTDTQPTITRATLRIYEALRKLGRPATAAEILAYGLSSTLVMAEINAALAELETAGFVDAKWQTEAYRPGSRLQVVRKYFSIPEAPRITKKGTRE
jgi:hypothetical protein